MKTISSTNFLGLPHPKAEAMLLTYTSNVRGVGTLYQWQELPPVEVTHCEYHTSGLNPDGTLKHGFPVNEWCRCPCVLELEVEPSTSELQCL